MYIPMSVVGDQIRTLQSNVLTKAWIHHNHIKATVTVVIAIVEIRN